MLLQSVTVFAASSIVNSSVFLSAYVDVTYVFFGTISNIFSYLDTLLRPGMYLIKFASACPLSHKSPSLSTFPYTSFKFNVLSIDKTAETSFNGFRVSPNLILLLVSLCIFVQKNKANRVLSNEFLLTLTKFYKIILLYGVLLFFFSIKIIHQSFPTYNFLFFSL